MLTEKLSDGIKMICSRPMLADEEKFKVYMSTLEEGDEKEDGRINPLKTVEESEDIKLKKIEIEKVLDEAFMELEVYQKDLLPFIKIHQDHCALNFDKLEGQTEVAYRQLVEKIDLDKVNIAQKLEENRILGIISVDATEMKITIMNKPEESRKSMEVIIPTHCAKIVWTLMEQLKVIEKGLTPASSEPMNVWEINMYVNYKKFLEEHRRNSDNYDEMLIKAKSLHVIMGEFKMKLSNKSKKELETLESKWKNVKEKLKSAFEKAEAAESAQKAALAKKVPSMHERLNDILKLLNDEKFYKKTESPQTIVKDLMEIQKKITIAGEDCKKIEDNEIYLQVPKDDFSESELLDKKFNHLLVFWTDQSFWHEKKSDWYGTQIKKIDTKEVSEKISLMKTNAKAAETYLKEKFELDFAIAKEFVEQELEPLLSTIDVINNILKEWIEKYHWDMMAKKLQCKYTREAKELTFQVLMEIIKETKKRIKEEEKSDLKIEEWIAVIADQANHEQSLGEKFKKIQSKWDVHLSTAQFGKIFTVQDTDKILNNLSECLTSLDGILSNEYCGPFKDDAEKLYKDIARIEEIFFEMTIVESKLRLVDNLITRDEFKSQNLQSKYEEVQKAWKKYIKKAANAADAARETLSKTFPSTDNKVLTTYQEMSKKLDEIITEVELKAEERQQEYPRLFFMSNKEFIKVITESDRIKAVTYCLQKCFASVKDMLVVVEGEETRPTGIISAEGEEFKTKPITKKVSDSIDTVLKPIEETLKKDLKDKIKSYVSAMLDKEVPRTELVLASMGQAAFIGEGVVFTSNTETVIEEDEEYEDNMDTLVEEQVRASIDLGKMLTQAGSVPEIASKGIVLDEAKKLSIQALIVQFIHYRDLIEFLKNNDAHGANCFIWQQQLRYYIQVDIYAKQLDATFEYGCEYLGVRNPAPITPTVERCWISFTNALRNKFWSTVVGAPGVGKIKTIQDLAAALGKFCYPYVCTPDTTTHALDKLLIGTAGSQCWLIIEKANDLQYGVLSAFAHKLLTIRQLLLEDKNEWSPNAPLNSASINLAKPVAIAPKVLAQFNNCPYFDIFFIVDPTSSNKITVPHTIKNLFRPISVTTIDYAIAAEAWLYSFGFYASNFLSARLEKFMKCAKEILEMEGINNDLSLRTLYYIVKAAGSLKLLQPENKYENSHMVSAIKSVFQARLSDPHLANIEKIAKIIFQEAEIKPVPSEISIFTKEIVEQAKKNCLAEYDGDIIPKLAELHNIFKNKSGCVIVGDASSGKTKLLKLILECYKLLYASTGEKSEMITVFTKAYEKPELYGHFEGKDWVEGILADSLSKIVNIKNTKCLSVLHCDGPLDPIWIEQLQSAFESRKKLTLANGDFICLHSLSKVVFEVENLKNASPATLSKTGVIYLPKETLMPKNIISSWLNKLKANEKWKKTYDKIQAHLISLINGLFNLGLEARNSIAKIKEEKIQLSDNSIAIAFCNMFEAAYSAIEPEIADKKDLTEEKIKKFIGKIVVFSIAWALGGNLPSTKLKKIDDFIEENASMGDKPKETSCFDAYVKLRTEFTEFAPWTDLAPIFRANEPNSPTDPESAFAYSLERPFTQMFVPTKQLLRYKWLIETLAKDGKNVLIYGESGSGKTLLANCALSAYPKIDALSAQKQAEQVKKNETKFKKVNTSFTWHTTSKTLYEIIEERLDKKRKNLYSAPVGKRAAVFIDDVNLPKSDNYGNIPILESLRGMLEKRGYYDKSRFYWKHISKTAFVCAASPAIGGRKEISERFMRHFNVFYLNSTGYTEIRNLFETVISAHFNDFKKEYSVVKSSYLDAVLEIHDIMTQKFPGNPRNPHYLLSIKDACKVLSGLLLGKPQTIESTDEYAKLIISEFCRVYSDRLVTKKDQTEFIHEMDKIIEKHLSGKWKLESTTSVIFTGMMSGDIGEYKEVKNWRDVQKKLEEEQDRYNADLDNPEFKDKMEDQPLPKMNLVFFKEAVEFIIKISRILAIPRTHLLNIGPYYMGRHSLIFMAASIHHHEHLTISHNMRDFNITTRNIYTELKNCLLDAHKDPPEVRGVILQAKVGESKNEFEDIKDGHTPHVIEEYEKNTEIIMDALYQICATGDLKVIGIPIDFDARDYLHLVINIPNNPADLRLKMKMYPSLFSECYCIYQHEWPTEAHVAIATAQLQGKIEDPIKEKVSATVVKIQKSVEDEAKKAWAEEGRKILVETQQAKELARVFTEIYKKKSEILSKESAILKKAITNVQESEKLEKEYQDESANKKEEGEAKKKKTEECHKEIVTLEYFFDY